MNVLVVNIGSTSFKFRLLDMETERAIATGGVEAAGTGHDRAELALSVFVQSVRDYIGAYIVALGGIDVLVFTAGIGHRASEVRRRVCDGLGFLSIKLDDDRNKTQGDELFISADDSAVKILILETNEKLIVARQRRDVLLN